MGAKPKTIKKVIRSQIDNWLESIEDKNLVRDIKRDTIVTGGCIVSMFLGEKIRDFDIYFKTKETTKKVAEYYLNEYKEFIYNNQDDCVREHTISNLRGVAEDVVEVYIASRGVVEVDEDNSDYDLYGEGDLEETMKEIIAMGKPVDDEEAREYKQRPFHINFISPNAITLSNKIQIILRFYGNAEEIHKNFDFAHAMSWYDYHKNELVTPTETLHCILSKTLRYQGSLYPIASLFRMKKFIERGWKCSAGEIIKIAFQIKLIDFTSVEQLRQQLTGVDMLYMRSFIEALENFNKNNPGRSFDESYMVEVVDRIFSL